MKTRSFVLHIQIKEHMAFEILEKVLYVLRVMMPDTVKSYKLQEVFPDESKRKIKYRSLPNPLK